MDVAMRARPHEGTADEPPLLIYDADCAFCRRWVARWRARTGDRVRYAPLQRGGLLERLGIPRDEALRSVQLVLPTGERHQGADAVLRALSRAPGLDAVSRFGLLPGVRVVAEAAYRVIARHRTMAARLDALLFGAPARHAPRPKINRP
jgi:predicted DCC family thiol-disulfide oxidoreductase YuxK